METKRMIKAIIIAFFIIGGAVGALYSVKQKSIEANKQADMYLQEFENDNRRSLLEAVTFCNSIDTRDNVLNDKCSAIRTYYEQSLQELHNIVRSPKSMAAGRCMHVLMRAEQDDPDYQQKKLSELAKQAVDVYAFIHAKETGVVQWCDKYQPIAGFQTKYTNHFKYRKDIAIEILKLVYGDYGFDMVKKYVNDLAQDAIQTIERSYQDFKRDAALLGIVYYAKADYCRQVEATVDEIITIDEDYLKSIAPDIFF